MSWQTELILIKIILFAATAFDQEKKKKELELDMR